MKVKVIYIYFFFPVEKKGYIIYSHSRENLRKYERKLEI